MRRSAMAVLLVVLASSAFAEISSQKRALISELLRVSGAADVTLGYLADILAEQYGRPKAMATAEWMRQQMHSPEFARLVEKSRMELYDRYFTEKELQDLIAFYKSDAGRRLVEVQEQLSSEARRKFAGVMIEDLQQAGEKSRQARTQADIRTLAVAIEARATDTNNYPMSADIEAIAKVVEPTYIKTTPKTDGWGSAYRYIGSHDGAHYRIVSAGPDKKIDPASLEIGKLPAASCDDLIFEDGEFKRPPRTP